MGEHGRVRFIGERSPYLGHVFVRDQCLTGEGEIDEWLCLNCSLRGALSSMSNGSSRAVDLQPIVGGRDEIVVPAEELIQHPVAPQPFDRPADRQLASIPR